MVLIGLIFARPKGKIGATVSKENLAGNFTVLGFLAVGLAIFVVTPGIMIYHAETGEWPSGGHDVGIFTILGAMLVVAFVGSTINKSR